jgi:hypothetical protein
VQQLKQLDLGVQRCRKGLQQCRDWLRRWGDHRHDGCSGIGTVRVRPLLLLLLLLLPLLLARVIGLLLENSSLVLLLLPGAWAWAGSGRWLLVRRIGIKLLLLPNCPAPVGLHCVVVLALLLFRHAPEVGTRRPGRRPGSCSRLHGC